MERGLPLTSPIAKRLLTGLTINFRRCSRKTVSEIKLISSAEESTEVVEEHLLILFVRVLNLTIDKHLKLLNVREEPECIVVLLDTSLEMVRTKQKELLLEVL